MQSVTDTDFFTVVQLAILALVAYHLYLLRKIESAVRGRQRQPLRLPAMPSRNHSPATINREYRLTGAERSSSVHITIDPIIYDRTDQVQLAERDRWTTTAPVQETDGNAPGQTQPLPTMPSRNHSTVIINRLSGAARSSPGRITVEPVTYDRPHLSERDRWTTSVPVQETDGNAPDTTQWGMRESDQCTTAPVQETDSNAPSRLV